MSHKVNLRGLTLGGLLSITFTAGIFAARGAAQGSSGKTQTSVPGQAINVETMTKDQIRKLPPNTQIVVQGRQITKQAFLEELRNKAATKPAAAVSTDQIRTKFDAARAKLLEEQQAKLEAGKTRVYAEADRLTKLHTDMINSPTFLAIQKESQELAAQYANASPAVKAKIQARARELHIQLQQLQATGH